MLLAFGSVLRSLIANPSKRAGLIGGELTLLALALGEAGAELAEIPWHDPGNESKYFESRGGQGVAAPAG